MRGTKGLIIGLILGGIAHAGVYEEALSRYNHTDYTGAASLLKNRAEDARSLELLGRCYLMDADFRSAAGALEKAAALNPGSSTTLTWLGRAYGRRAETSFAVGAMTYALKARQSFERAVQLDPHNTDAMDDLFEFYLQAPGFMGGGADKAQSLIPLMARNSPSEAYFAQARLAEHRKDNRTAESELRRAAETSPQSPGRLLDLAGFLFAQGRFDESEKAFEKAESVAPSAPRVLFARAECYVRGRRNLDRARDLLKRYLAVKDLTPDDPPRAEALKLLKQSGGM